MKVSILIPIYNEQRNLQNFFNTLKEINEENYEFIIFNDGSTDNSLQIIKKNLAKNYIFINSLKNKGKGYAIQNTLQKANGEICIIQDADLEYNPHEIKKIIKKFDEDKNLIAVYGSRLLGLKNNQQFISSFRVFANKTLTKINNILNNQELTDAHTCYKAIKIDIFKSLNIKSNGFSLCAEINTKLSNMNINIKEIPISYKGRTKNEGKKIGFKDAIFSILTILKFRFFIKS